MRTRLGTSGGGAKTEAKLDSTIRILSHKEAKLKGEKVQARPAGCLADVCGAVAHLLGRCPGCREDLPLLSLGTQPLPPPPHLHPTLQ